MKLFFVIAASFGLAATAGDLTVSEIKELMKQRFPSLHINLINDSSLPGFYAVETASGDLLYFSKDGRYFIQGTAIDLEKRVNLNRQQIEDWNNLKSPLRKSDIAKLDEADMVVFKAPNEKHVISVFTDIDCGYCRKLHRERQDYLDLGITIRYLAYPRAGLKSSSAKKLEGIWCSSDRQKAMTDAKLNQIFKKASCANPIEKHLEFVKKYRLTGTPAILAENGNLYYGAIPPEQLLAKLEDIGKN